MHPPGTLAVPPRDPAPQPSVEPFASVEPPAADPYPSAGSAACPAAQDEGAGVLPVTEPLPGDGDLRRPRGWGPGAWWSGVLGVAGRWPGMRTAGGRVPTGFRTSRRGRSGGWRPDPGVGGRLLFAVLLAAVQVVGSLLLAPLQPDRAVPDTPQAAALLLAAPATLVLTRAPVVRAIVATAAASAYLAAGYPAGPVLLGAGVALVLAVRAGRQVEAWLVAAAGLLGAPAVSRLGGVPMALTPALVWAGWVAALLALSELVRARREAALVWSRARTRLRLLQAGEERAEVARDLQDEAVHRLQLIRARVESALAPLEAVTAVPVEPLLPSARLVRADPRAVPLDARPAPAEVWTALADARAAVTQAGAALVAVQEAADRALAELRVAGDVLAAEGETLPRPATPGLAALTELAEQWAGAGLVVRAAGDPGQLNEGVDRVAYRVVQEALANVAQHSRAPHADLALHRDLDQLTVLVSDAGPPQVPPGSPAGVPTGWDLAAPGDPDLPWSPDGEAAAGHGLARMHERVCALGGALSAGPDGDGWCVHVVLPAGPPA